MRYSLTELAVKYFKKKGYKIEQKVTLEGFSGLTRKFDMLIQKGNERRIVWIKDWKRTVGVNIVINIDKASADVGITRPIIISDKFSGHAKAYANRRGVTLLTKREILRYLR
jgi:HJR/Mrr/RecB family endonuclease